MSGIIRVKKDGDFFWAAGDPFNEVGLSWEARGVMGYLLSKPDGWQCRDNDLINKGSAGEYKIKRILKELKQFGYITRTRRRNKETGRFEWDTTVHNTPVELKDRTLPSTIGRFSINGPPINGKPHHIVLINLDKEEVVKADPDFAKICTHYQNEIGPISPIIRDKILDAVGIYPAAWIEQAIARAVEQNVRKWVYIEGILKNWQAKGGPQNDKPRKGKSNERDTSNRTTEYFDPATGKTHPMP